MESFLFAVNAIAPIVLTVALGYILKKIGFMDERFTKMANKLVFRVFLPCMLFLNVYKIESIGDIDLGYVIYAVGMGLVIVLLGLPAVMLLSKRPEQRGEDYRENLIDEIADATIMIEQIKMMHDIDNKDVSARISHKLYRQMCRIEQEEREDADN